MSIVEQQSCNIHNDVKNMHDDNSFLSELISTVQNYPVVWDIPTRSYQNLHKNQSWKNIALQLRCEGK